MSIVLNRIKEKVDMDEIPQRVLAQVSGVSRSAVGLFLNEKHEINFYAMLKIVRFLFSMTEEREYMENYILSLQKKENIRSALEYCSLHQLIDLMDYLLEKEINSNNPTNVKWAKLYKLFHEMNIKQKSPAQIRKQLKSFAVSSHEMYILVRMIEVLSFYHEKDYCTMMRISRGLLEEIAGVNNPFIKDCFRMRILLIYSYIYRRSNQLEKAKQCAFQVIQLGLNDRFTAIAYQYLCYCHCLDDYEKAVHYLDEAREKFEMIGDTKRLEGVFHDYTFLSNLWDKEEKQTNDIEELAHRQIKKGNRTYGLALLEQVKPGPFTFYYKGLATGNRRWFWKSYQWFLNEGDLLFSQLPQRELIKCGVSKESVKTAYITTYHHITAFDSI